MKITLNANITPDTVIGFLKKQQDKKDKIIKFCNDNKINELTYKDSELEFEYKQEFTKPKPKIETRGGGNNGKD